jgi:hypothetical protein
LRIVGYQRRATIAFHVDDKTITIDRPHRAADAAGRASIWLRDHFWRSTEPSTRNGIKISFRGAAEMRGHGAMP